MGEYGEKAIKVTWWTSEISLRIFLELCRDVLADRDNPKHGEQSLKSLNTQGRQIESVEMAGEDMKAFRRELRRYAVDFSVTREGGDGPYQVYFKAQDVDRVYTGLRKCLESFAGAGERKPIREVMRQAVEKAKERQAAREWAARTRVPDRERVGR